MLASAPSPTYDVFAVAAPGLAPLIAEELQELGISGVTTAGAGVAFRADAAALYRANLQLRIATRLLVRAASFRAAHFSELEKASRAVPWSRWIAERSVIAVRVTSRKSRLYHSDAVAQRVLQAITRAVGGVTAEEAPDEEGDTNAQLVVVRVERDVCAISIDSSGDLLHRRGYRQAVAKAPLRETLAAALLRAGRWDPTTPLVDPLCGSGTIPIEAAMFARRVPPGLNRRFAFERWPEFDSQTWGRVRERAEEGITPMASAPIVGSDRDAGAIEAAQSNATRAGVALDVEFIQQPLSRATAPSGPPGLLIANPPYGERIGDAGALRDLYASFGRLARSTFPQYRCALFAADAKLVGHAQLDVHPMVSTSNGGIRVALYVGRGSKDP